METGSLIWAGSLNLTITQQPSMNALKLSPSAIKNSGILTALHLLWENKQLLMRIIVLEADNETTTKLNS